MALVPLPAVLATSREIIVQSREVGALEAVDRSAAGPTAPAHGLYLIGVDYPAI